MGLTMIPRDDWGGYTPPGGFAPIDWDRREVFAVHHSTGRTLGDRDPEVWLQAIDHYHRGGRGRHPSITQGLGYNAVASWGTTPRLYEGRGLDRLGAHIAGHNTRSVGLCVLGDYRSDQDILTNPMRALITEVWREVCDRAGRVLTPTGHGELAWTACPGDQLQTFVRKLREGGTDGPTTDPAPGQPLPFPLPRGYFFGPKSWGTESVSGHYRRTFGDRTDRQWLQEWVRQLRRRGWAAGKGRTWLRRHGSDGLYGAEHRALIRAFQADQGLAVDGLLGPRTWDAAYLNRVT